jgi:hypothetical protein
MNPTEKGMYFLAQLRRAVAEDYLARPPTLAAWQQSIRSLGDALVEADLLELDDLMVQEQARSGGQGSPASA